MASKKTSKTAPSADLVDVKSAPGALLATDPDLLLRACQSMDVDIPDSEQDLKDLLIAQENALARASAKQGFCFLALKDRIGHGSFESWLDDHRFNKRSVREKMQAAKYLLNQPADMQPKLIGLGQKKLIALAQAEPDVIAELLNSTNADDLDDLTVIDLKQKIKKLEKANHNLNADLETAKESRDHLKGILAATDPDKQPFLIETRQEFAALSDRGMLAIESMEQLVGALERLSPLDNSPSDFTDQRNIAINTACVHVSALFARAQQLMQRLGDVFGTERINPVLVDHADLKYGESELALALENRQLIYAEHKEEAYAREANRPRSAGRPQKSK